MTNSAAPIVTMVLADRDSNQQTVELPGPGGTIRFGIGEPGQRAAVWRVWANEGKSDVYVGVRDLLGEQKWSLHETGDWRHQWVNRERVAVTGQRIIDQWDQPAPMGDTGWTRGISVWVRHEDVIDVPDDEKRRTPRSSGCQHNRTDSPSGCTSSSRRRTTCSPIFAARYPSTGFTLADGRVVLLVVSREKIRRRDGGETGERSRSGRRCGERGRYRSRLGSRAENLARDAERQRRPDRVGSRGEALTGD
ncbi:hypothetical protein OG921_20925 [Aldersonia sp. NBC_00410]|uniref:hypothetical protein n=1 Tax=Aldersonia sp. NBC_00410 TaxID=2975954 RepID=UPI0022566CE6|nr:hypothetical protein [Aldersonia sp. NBC_00410]MCX5045633.1 hypothetical protein [Aldersonia sp. NBC_00410]